MQFKKLIRRSLAENPFRLKGSYVLGFFFFYFAFHLISGERGLIAYVKLKHEYEKARQQSIALQMERKQLGNRVNLLRSDSLDLDLLEEVAKKNLGYSEKNEIIYFSNDVKD